uniref:Uncharacterized protein n=1 Tax=viral metagenome TaxID=1070528 RepID=A0A6M3JQE1_9ZZZZ
MNFLKWCGLTLTITFTISSFLLVGIELTHSTGYVQIFGIILLLTVGWTIGQITRDIRQWGK